MPSGCAAVMSGVLSLCQLASRVTVWQSRSSWATSRRVCSASCVAGTSDGVSSPCSSNSATHSAPLTSVLASGHGFHVCGVEQPSFHGLLQPSRRAASQQVEVDSIAAICTHTRSASRASSQSLITSNEPVVVLNVLVSECRPPSARGAEARSPVILPTLEADGRVVRDLHTDDSHPARKG